MLVGHFDGIVDDRLDRKGNEIKRETSKSPFPINWTGESGRYLEKSKPKTRHDFFSRIGMIWTID